MRGGAWNILREPALWVGVLAVLAQWVPPIIMTLSPGVASIVNAAIVAVAGALTAYLVHSDKLAPAIMGAVQAVLALGLGLGLHLPQDIQAEVMAAITALVAAYVRTQVFAVVPPRPSPPYDALTA